MTFPQRGDQLFITDGWWQHTVDVNTSERWGGIEYIYGYRKAAEGLLHQLEQDSSIGAMNLAYPIINLYRHHIELSLKSAVADGYSAAEEVERRKVRSFGHRIDDLWHEFRRLAGVTHPGDSVEAFDAAEACVMELAGHDPRGTTFRYPGEPGTARPLQRVNLRHFIDIAARVSDLIDAVKHTWAAEFDARSEYEEERRSLEADHLLAEADAATADYYEAGE